MEQVGSLVSTFPMRDRNEVASSLSFGTFHVPTHAVEDIGAVVDWLTECCEFHADAKSNLAVLHNRIPIYSVPAIGYLLPMTPLFPEGSPLVPA